MVKREIVMNNKSGLHARLATMLIKKASMYKSEILITKGNAKVSAKSILGLCSLGVTYKDIIEIEAIGEDEELAINELEKYILELND